MTVDYRAELGDEPDARCALDASSLGLPRDLDRTDANSFLVQAGLLVLFFAVLSSFPCVEDASPFFGGSLA